MRKSVIILKLRGKKIKVDGFIGTMCAVQLHSISQNLDKWTSGRNVSSRGLVENHWEDILREDSVSQFWRWEFLWRYSYIIRHRIHARRRYRNGMKKRINSTGRFLNDTIATVLLRLYNVSKLANTNFLFPQSAVQPFWPEDSLRTVELQVCLCTNYLLPRKIRKG